MHKDLYKENRDLCRRCPRTYHYTNYCGPPLVGILLRDRPFDFLGGGGGLGFFPEPSFFPQQKARIFFFRGHKSKFLSFKAYSRNIDYLVYYTFMHQLSAASKLCV